MMAEEVRAQGGEARGSVGEARGKRRNERREWKGAEGRDSKTRKGNARDEAVETW